MNEERSSAVECALWFRPSGGVFYLIPDDVEPPPGELELRTLTGKRLLVDENAATAWLADEGAVREHLTGRARDGLQKFAAELGAAWRQGLAGASPTATEVRPEAPAVGEPAGESRDLPASATAPELMRAAERAESGAQVIEAAAKSITSALRSLSEQLDKASQKAAANKAGEGEGSGQSEDGQGRNGDPSNTGSS